MVEAVPESMRAAVLTGPRQVELRRVPVPRPGPGEVLVKVEGCGLCGSNVPVWEGRPWFDYPLAAGSPGHEGWGRVVALGSDDIEVGVGDRVGFLSERALGEYDAVSAASTVRLPARLDDLQIPAEPLGCAFNAFHRADIQAGQRVVVIGVGFLGAVLVRLASAAGAHVIAMSRRPFALEIARALGADEVLPVDGERDDMVAAVEAGGLCERVFEAAGVQSTLSLAERLVAVRGRLIVVGFHQDGPRQVDMQLWNWRGIDVINAHERDPRAYVAGMRAAVEAIDAGVIDPRRLVTHSFALDRAGDAFDALVSRPDGFLKAVVTP